MSHKELSRSDSAGVLQKKRPARRVRAERARSGEAAPLACPRCKTLLHATSFKDTPVNRCYACGGIWLDRGVLPEIMEGNKSQAAKLSQSREISLRSIWPKGLRFSNGRPGGRL